MFTPVFTPDSVTLPKAVISEFEAKARCLLETFDWRNGPQAENVCIQVFKREWGSALTVERIQALAKVCTYFEGDLQPALTALCRKKILRSRVVSSFGKQRLYEINI